MSLRRCVVYDVRSIEENNFVEEDVTRMSPKRKQKNDEDYLPLLMMSELTTSSTKATTQSSEVASPYIVHLNRAFSQDWSVTISPKSSPIKKKSLSSFLRSFLNKNTCLIIGTITLVLFLANIIVKEEFGSNYRPSPIPHDYSDLQSMYELKIGQVDHWCLGGGDDSCTCEDPTEPFSRDEETEGWASAHDMNKDLIKEGKIMLEKNAEKEAKQNRNIPSLVIEKSTSKKFDVVLLGDSIVEEWNARWSGKFVHMSFSKIKKIWYNLFTKNGGGKIDGLALGIAGDRSPNLLWRIQNGEMPDDLQAKVWWVLVGTNDFGARGCSEEVVLMGILRVVEEIRLRRPNDPIVINGILPRTSMQDGRLEGRISHEETYFQHLWPSIQVVNKELKRFADKHMDIHYFDASNLFLTQLSNEDYTRNEKVIPTELMSDHHHPTSLGHEIWGKAIVDKVIELSGEDDDDVDDDGHEVDTYRQKYYN